MRWGVVIVRNYILWYLLFLSIVSLISFVVSLVLFGWKVTKRNVEGVLSVIEFEWGYKYWKKKRGIK